MNSLDKGDARAAGTAPEAINDALAIVRERQADTIADRTPERAEAEYAAGMQALESEGVTAGQLDAARAFIADLDKLAPGTIASLERTGAGSDPRLIRLVIREATRRGYGRGAK